MSIECGECEMEARSGHEPWCSRATGKRKPKAAAPVGAVPQDLIARLTREAAAWESWNADYSDQPAECCVTSPPLLREAAAALASQAARMEERDMLIDMLLKRQRLRWHATPAFSGERIAHGIVVDPLELLALRSN